MMRSLRDAVARPVLLAAIAAIGLASPAGGRLTRAEPLRYRRVFVPETDLEHEIRGLLPLKREEFEQRLSQVQRRTQPGAPAAAARLVRATYSARVEGTQLVRGTAELEFRGQPDSPAVVPLGKCNLALAGARWKGEPERPAALGQDSEGRLVCVVESDGVLLWDWSLTGGADAGGVVTFAPQLPPATVSALRLELPDDRELSVEGGIAEHVGGTWLVEVGGTHVVKLIVAPRSAGGAAPPLVTVREQSSYSVLRSSLDLDTALQVETFQTPLPTLTLRVDRPLEITRIRAGDETLPWTVTGSDEAATSVVVTPPTAAGQAFSLDIQATGAWSAESPTTLPRITAPGTLYQEGRATVSAAAELGLEPRPVKGCWQAGVTPAAGRGNEQFQFRLHEPGAAIEIAANLAPVGIRELSGTQVVIDGTKVSAVMTSELTSLGGKYFQLEAHLPRRWIVDAVDVLPPEALSDRTLTPEGPNRQLLRLNLQYALHDKPLRVVIRARHRLPPAGEPLAEGFYRLATFADARASRRLVAVRTTEAGTRLDLQGDERLNRFEPLQLPEAEMKLFEAVPGTLLFADDANAAGLTATLATAAAAFRVDAALDAQFSGRRVQQALTLQCVPESSPVGALVVRLSPRPAGAIDWKLVGDEQRELSVVPVAAEDGASLEDGGAAYRLTLNPPRSAPFSVVASWSSAAAGPIPLTLAAVPDATAQSGIVTVRSQDGAHLVAAFDDMESLPVAMHDAGDGGMLVGTYAYRPGSRAQLRVHAADARSATGAVRIESLRVQSRFSIDGRGEHAALVRVSNYGAAQLDLRVSPAALDVRLVDEASGGVSALPRAAGGQIAIPLPAGQREASVQLRYSSEPPAESWWPWGRLEAPIPESDIPPLSRSWNVALCPGLQAGDSTAAAVRGTATNASATNASVRTPAAMLSRFPGLSLASRAAGPIASGTDEPGLAGWSAYELELPPGPVASLRVFRPHIIASLAVALFLLTTVGTVTLAARRRTWIWPLAIVLLVASVLAPPELGAITLAVALGLAAGGLGLLLGPQAIAARPARTPTTVRRTLPVLLGCVLLAGGDRERAQGQESRPEAGAARPAPDHRVVIATGDDQQPVGEYVYLTPELYERLHKPADADAARLPEWLLVAARYHFPQPPRLTGTAASLDELGIRIDLTTFGADAQVALPFRRDQLTLLEARARLDGEPVAVSWREDGTALLVPVASPGRHQLQLACGAPLQKADGAAVLDLVIPTVSQCTVTTPLSLESQPSIASAAVAAEAGDVSARHFRLGPVTKLTARWPLGEPVAVAAQLEVDQLSWWKLQPGAVLLRGKYRLRPIGGTLDRVELHVDPRLRLVPGSISPKSAAVEVSPGTPQVVRIVPAEPTESELVVTAEWLWVGASGAGNLTLPRVAVRGDRIVRSWTGVSVDPALALEPGTNAGNRVSVDDFLIDWSEPESPPALALDDLPDRTPVGLIVLPAAPEPQAAISARWSLDAQQARLSLETRLSQVPSVRFRHELDLPPALKVQQIRLTAAGSPLPHRWHQRPDGRVVVTLLGPPPPEQLLELEAALPRARNRPRLPLPVVSLQDATTTDATIRIYRQPRVAAQLQASPGWERLAEPEIGQHVPERGRLVAALRSPLPASLRSSLLPAAPRSPLPELPRRAGGGAPSQPVVTVNPNEPQSSNRLAVRVAELDGQWIAEADVNLSVHEGALDAIQLELPAEWSGPFSIEPAVEHRVISLPGAATHLLITPQQAITGDFHLSIRGPLRNRTLDPIRAPEIAVLESQAEERIVVLQARGSPQPLVWETRGLQAANPSGLRLPKGWLASDQEYYQVVASSYQATAVSAASPPKQPRVILADVEIQRQGSRHLVGRARFYVLPPAAGELTLVMPTDTRLIQVLLDGSHCSCRADGLRQRRIAVNTLDVPVFLEVIYESSLPPTANEGEMALTAPRLKGLPVARTIWTAADIQSDTNAKGQSPLRRISATEAAVVKAEALAGELARLAELPATDLPPALLAAVHSRWRDDFETAHRNAAALPGQPRQQAAELSARLSQARQAADNARRRLAEAGIPILPAAEPAATDAQRDLNRGDSANRTTLVSDGPRESILVRLPAKSSPGQQRWLSAALLAALLGGAWLLFQVAKARDLAAAHAPAIVAAAGLGWWLLTPWGAWLGWIGVGLAIWLALRSLKLAREASSTLRSVG